MLNRKDLIAGAIYILFGLFFLITAVVEYDIGTAFQMGPGFFPAILGALLAVFGAIIILQGFRTVAIADAPIPWRAVAFITAAFLFFGIAIQPLGLVPALIVSLLLASAASRRATFLSGLAVTVCLTAFCLVVFVYGVGLPLPLVGAWFGG